MWADRQERNFMNGLLAVLAVSWAILASASRIMGVTPLVPWLPGARLALVALPAGFGIWFVGEVLGRIPSRKLAAGLAAMCGMGLVLFWRINVLTPYIVIGLWGLLIARLALGSDAIAAKVLWGITAMTMWAALVPHENYIALKLSRGQFHDATFRAMDFLIFRHLIGLQDYVGAFPLVREANVLRILENGYLTMTFQPIVVIFCLYRQRYGMAQLFIAGPICYLIAGIVFAAYPVFGPIFLYADTFDPHLHQSITWLVSSALRNEMNAALTGSATVSGGGYFIGLPSMHVALGTICQYAVRATPTVFWILLPLNIALVVSTIVLGLHYVADAVAGMALGLVVSVAVARWLAPRQRELAA